MAHTARFSERIGAVFLPEADSVVFDEDAVAADEPVPFPQPFPFPPPRLCKTTLKSGCYTVSFIPNGVTIFGPRYRGTMRFETTSAGARFSGDLYSYRLLEDFVLTSPAHALRRLELERPDLVSDEAADTGGTIPAYKRRSYFSYLKGTSARLSSFIPPHAPCRFTLQFDEFKYVHPTTGFSGSFPTAPSRTVRFVLAKTPVSNLYTGEAFAGTTKIGTVSIRWISAFFRRAALQINTLQGAETPPAVGTTNIASIFADAGWQLTVTDGGTVQLPQALAGTNINACWSEANLHTLMGSVPGYNPATLDSAWRTHLVSVPAKLNCSRGIMFDSSLGADPNAVPREGAATFSRDGYPATDVPDGSGGSHYDAAAGQQQRNVPRAFLRSATHEVGHAFNQIHQGFEGGNDNSIMTPTPGVAATIGLAGNFPAQINLAFNETVKKHLRHLPDPAVRPGAMDFFGSAVAAPEPADVVWLDAADVSVGLSSDRIRLGEPVSLDFELTNRGDVALPTPDSLDVESLIVRVSVTDPAGGVTFMRPAVVDSCPTIRVQELEPEASVKGSTVLYWGRDGFAFSMPGRHVVEVIVMWYIAGVPVASSAERDVYVAYPTSDEDNEVAALLLDPEVGAAVAAGDVSRFERAAERIEQATAAAKGHPAVAALNRLGVAKPPRPRRSTKGRKKSS
jgi:hypothetical protein